ncbi:MAG TPA: hypothetical protein QGF05_11160, partial [Dehalococcoidia bacterium]|nr:hypothetical protein [Dehalococcoidia bacterium]
MPVGKQKLRLTVWYKLLAPGSVYASVVTNAYDGTQLQYLSSPRQTTVSRWAELTYDFVTDPRTRSMSLYLRPTVDGILFDDASLVALDAPVAAAFAPVDRSLKWTAETVEAELKRYEPALKGFGIKDPLRWARARIAAERDWVGRQGWWERRIAHWRFMFLGDEPVDWARWLDLDHPALAGRKAQLAAGGATARQAWAEHVREEKPNLRPLLNDRATRIILFEASDPKVYPPDGSFSPERAEALLEGKVTGLHQVPEEGEGDYGWIQTCNPAGWHLRYLGLAYYHDRDPKW